MKIDAEIDRFRPQKQPATSAWTTENELAWLQNIGNCWRRVPTDDTPSLNELGRRQHYDRVKLLQEYRQAMSKRKRWGQIDRFQIMRYLDETLKAVPEPELPDTVLAQRLWQNFEYYFEPDKPNETQNRKTTGA